MPVVPFAPKQEPQAQAPQVDPNFLLMAAAMMHKEGRLQTQSKEKLDADRTLPR